MDDDDNRGCTSQEGLRRIEVLSKRPPMRGVRTLPRMECAGPK